MERIALLTEVLEELERRGVSYCVLRNYDFLLEKRTLLSASEKSVDLVIARKDLLLFEKIMEQFSFLKRKPQFSLTHHAYFRFEGNEIISFDVQVGGVHWNDMLYLDETDILQNRVKRSFFYVPSENDTFLMLLVHSLLGKRHFKPEYQSTLQELSLAINKDYVLGCLQDIFTSAVALELITLVLNGSFDKIIDKKWKYIFIFICRKRRWLIFIPLFFRWLHWKKILQPFPLISIIGPDGAGKSTMVDGLKACLERQGKKVALIYTGRGRNHLLPFGKIGKKYKSLEKQREKVQKQQKNNYQKSSLWKRKIPYTLAAPVFTLDLWLRYWFQIFPQRLRRKVVVTDRYCTDLLLMPHTPVWLKKMLLELFPRPTLTFYLYNAPEVLHERRNEESVEELERQLQLFAVLEIIIKPIKIKTTHAAEDKEEVVKRVMELLYREWY